MRLRMRARTVRSYARHLQRRARPFPRTLASFVSVEVTAKMSSSLCVVEPCSTPARAQGRVQRNGQAHTAAQARMARGTEEVSKNIIKHARRLGAREGSVTRRGARRAGSDEHAPPTKQRLRANARHTHTRCHTRADTARARRCRPT